MTYRWAQGPRVDVEVSVQAPPEAIWPFVSDINVPARFSAEFLDGTWLDGAAGPALGARFAGHNGRDGREWTVPCTVVEFEPQQAFAWSVGPDATGDWIATWRFSLHPQADGSTRLKQGVSVGPGGSPLRQLCEQSPEREHEFIAARLSTFRTNMAATVAGIAALAEGALT